MPAEGEDGSQTLQELETSVREKLADVDPSLYHIEASGDGFRVTSRRAVERSVDVSGDGEASPIDALMNINALNAKGSHQLPGWPSLAEIRGDVNRDGHLSPIDALEIINFLNDASARNTTAEGEATGFFALSAAEVVHRPVDLAAARAVNSSTSVAEPSRSTSAVQFSPAALLPLRDSGSPQAEYRPDAIGDEWTDDFWNSPEEELTLDLLALA